MHRVFAEFEIRSVEIGLGFDYRSLGVSEIGRLGVWEFGEWEFRSLGVWELEI
jgi:hypothetical protein